MIRQPSMEEASGTNDQTPLLVDYDAASMIPPGQLLTAWQTALDTNTLVCRARPFPVFGYTNVIFILTNKAR